MTFNGINQHATNIDNHLKIALAMMAHESFNSFDVTQSNKMLSNHIYICISLPHVIYISTTLLHVA